MTAKHPNSVPPQIVYPPGPIEHQANTVPRGMLFGGGGLMCGGGVGSQWIGTQPAYAVLHPGLCHDLVDTLPFLSLEVPCDFLGSLLLNFVFHFSVFLNPGWGVYRQAPGRSMGTNAAPPWAQLMLRAYERASPLPSPWALFRFIDDGFLLFLAEDAAAVKQYLVRMYPADLPFSFDHDCVRANVPFLDVLYIVVSLWPLRISIFWKPHLYCLGCLRPAPYTYAVGAW